MALADPHNCNWLPACFQHVEIGDTYVSGIVSNEEELEKVIQSHSAKTLSSFVFWCDDKHKNLKAKQKRRLLWKCEGFGGNVPLVVNRRKIFECQYGKSYTKNESSHQKTDDHGYRKEGRFHVQNTRKVNCPAKIFVRYITRYEDYQVKEGSPKNQRTAMLASLEADLAKGIASGCEIIHVKLPLIEGHQNHNITPESAFTRHIHPEVKKKIYEYVGLGIISVALMKKSLEQFVVKELCPSNDIQPSKQDSCFFPSNRTIRNHVHLALCFGRYSSFDQINLEERIKTWQTNDKASHLFFRKCTNTPEDIETEQNIPDSDHMEGDNSAAKNTFLFVHQTFKQTQLLKRYGDMVLIDATYKTTKYALPLFLVVVRTNVGYIPVAEFITEDETTNSITEALRLIKSWNPSWTPKYFMLDYCEQEYQALSTVFPDAQKFICAFHREQAWVRWSKENKNHLSEDQKATFLHAMRKVAAAHTEESCTAEIAKVRSSLLYKENHNVRTYLENRWLCICETEKASNYMSK